MLSFIFLSIVALALCLFHSLSRAAIAIPVVAVAIASYYISPLVEPSYYFLVNGSMSAIVVALLQIPKQTHLNVDIQIINGMALLAHGLGHVLWHFEQSAYIYNAIILVLGVTEFARLIIKTRMDAREYEARGGYDLIRDAFRLSRLGGSR